jgi:hypothetical protein
MNSESTPATIEIVHAGSICARLADPLAKHRGVRVDISYDDLRLPQTLSAFDKVAMTSHIENWSRETLKAAGEIAPNAYLFWLRELRVATRVNGDRP